MFALYASHGYTLLCDHVRHNFIEIRRNPLRLL